VIQFYRENFIPEAIIPGPERLGEDGEMLPEDGILPVPENTEKLGEDGEILPGKVRVTGPVKLGEDEIPPDSLLLRLIGARMKEMDIIYRYTASLRAKLTKKLGLLIMLIFNTTEAMFWKEFLDSKWTRTLRTLSNLKSWKIWTQNQNM
jgi:hypothetical protein